MQGGPLRRAQWREQTRSRARAQAVEKTAAGNADGQRITFNLIKARLGDVLYQLTSMKFKEPSDGEDALREHYAGLRDTLTDKFRSLEEEFR